MDDGLAAARLVSPAQLEQILLLLPTLLPLRSLLAAECVNREMPSFDALHRVSTPIVRPRRAARLGPPEIGMQPHRSHSWLRGTVPCALADEANL